MEITPELKNTATEVVPSRGPRSVKSTKPESVNPEVSDRKDLNYQWRRGMQLVKIKFVNDETPGEVKEFALKMFKQEPIKIWRFKDHGIYEVPLYVAEHLNTNCKIPLYGLKKDEDGNMVEAITGWKNRCHAESLDFHMIGEDNPFKADKSPLLKQYAM
jgi:hypothetical protein